MVQTYPESQGISGFSVPERSGPPEGNPSRRPMEMKHTGMRTSETHLHSSNPWWLFFIGLYEIATLTYASVSTVYFYMDGKAALKALPSGGNDTVVMITYICSCIAFTVTVVFSGIMTFLMLASIILQEEKTKRSALKWWTYGSYVICLLKIVGIGIMLKSLLVGGSIMEKTDMLKGNPTVVLALVAGIADLMLRSMGVAAVGYLRTLLSFKILRNEHASGIA